MRPPSPWCPTCGEHVTGTVVPAPPRMSEMPDPYAAVEPIRVGFDPCGHQVPDDWQWTSPTYPTELTAQNV